MSFGDPKKRARRQTIGQKIKEGILKKCPDCDSSSERSASRRGEFKPFCVTCRGTGAIDPNQPITTFEALLNCPECEGAGTVNGVIGAPSCPRCDGSGHVSVSQPEPDLDEDALDEVERLFES